MSRLDWEDCPVLGAGWKRREVFRKSGASLGKTDVYYMSPSKELIRSKIKLAEVLGDDIDLSIFDFRRGVIIPHDQRKSIPKQSLPGESNVKQKPKKPRLSEPVQTSAEPQQGGELVQCQGCKIWTTEYVKSKKSLPYCTKCQASRSLQKKNKALKPIIIQPLESPSCGAKKFAIKNPFEGKEKQSRKGKLLLKKELDEPEFHKPFKDPEMSSDPTNKDYMEVQHSEDKAMPLAKHNGADATLDELKSSDVRVVVIKEVMVGEVVSYDGSEQLEPLNLKTGNAVAAYVPEDDEGTPVIKDVYSLVSHDAMAELDPALRRLMENLKEIPLPAYWEVQENTAPNLQLIQRDKRNPMWNCVIYIRPSFQFFVTVKDHPVPSNHKLYTSLPRQLATVYDVVELICSLEALRPCTRMYAPRALPDGCRVLVEEGPCEECREASRPSESKP
uniref:MBD domain-containing protein n=1 Tax=Leptobrachium leishanense TaxID=445787 RepID=A0A8C5QQX4_9ANUR